MLSLLSYLKSAFIACISAIIAITNTITQVIIAAPYTYLSAVWAGSENPAWPHLALVPLSALAGIAVGAGIVFERPKYSARVHRVAFWLVVGGVAIESLCTISLFVVDERISQAQQSKIIALETRIAPRFISVDARNRISEKMKPFRGQQYSGMVADVNDAWDIWREISLSLTLAGWQLLPPSFGHGAGTHAGLGPLAGIAVGAEPGVMIMYSSGTSLGLALQPRVQALADALRAEGIAAGPDMAGGAIDSTPNVMVIAIGPKPQ